MKIRTMLIGGSAMNFFVRPDVKPYPSIRKTHPLKQRQLRELVDFTKENFPSVKCIAVFGSTVDGRCRPVSDIDICVWGGKEAHFYTPPNDVYDVIFAEDLEKDSPLYKRIFEEAWVIYAKDLDEASVG